MFGFEIAFYQESRRYKNGRLDITSKHKDLYFQAYKRRLKAYKVCVVKSGMEQGVWIALVVCATPAHVTTSNRSSPSSSGFQNTGIVSIASLAESSIATESNFST